MAGELPSTLVFGAGAALSKAILRGHNLRGLNLSGADLSGADLGVCRETSRAYSARANSPDPGQVGDVAAILPMCFGLRSNGRKAATSPIFPRPGPPRGPACRQAGVRLKKLTSQRRSSVPSTA